MERVMKTLRLIDPRLLWALVIGAAYLTTRALGVELPGGEALGLGSGLALLGAFGHCDTLDGPVIQLARQALETGNVNLVLPWVRSADEDEIRHAFEHAQAVRKLGPEARNLADTHFFETLVRIHRAG